MRKSTGGQAAPNRGMVRLDNDLARAIRSIAAGLGISPSEYASGKLWPIVQKEYPGVLASLGIEPKMTAPE